VDTKKVGLLMIPLHIKRCIMKQFVKVLPKDGDNFKYLASKFPRLSEAKLKEGLSSVLTSEKSWKAKYFRPNWKTLRDRLGNPLQKL